MPATGSYGCVNIPGFFGWAIRHLTGSQYDHAFVVIDGTPGHEIILEAAPAGSRLAPLAKYGHLPMIFSEDRITANDQVLLDTAIESYVGIPYGFLDIAYLGMVLTDLWVPPFVKDAVLDQKNMICSQLVAQFGARFGKDWSCGQADVQFVTPGMLAERVGA